VNLSLLLLSYRHITVATFHHDSQGSWGSRVSLLLVHHDGWGSWGSRVSLLQLNFKSFSFQFHKSSWVHI